MADPTPLNEKEKTPERKDIALPIDWHIPDSLPTYRVTNMVSQILEDELVLSFFEQRGPIVTNDYGYEKAAQLEALKALCVARICITPARLESFIKVLNQQLEKLAKPKNTTNEPPEK